MKTDTIAAIATALSNAGISIIRISGSDSLEIIDKIYTPKTGYKKISEQKSHTIHYGYIISENQIIDEVMVAIMKGPNSYTKEDIIEIDCHGGIVVTKKILEIVLKNGARPAEPGEFTKRAFLNGRIDLSQAEAVIEIINAKNDMALKSSVQQLKGNIRDKIIEIRTIIVRDIAFIEAALDDPEHININGFSCELKNHIENILFRLNHLLESADNGKILKEGIKTVILGKPNAGKSSLLNLFLGEERAIVTDVEGTTRDTLEESINLGGIVLNLVDTAGIRNTNDSVEKIGVEKARKIAKDADLVIYVVDSSKDLDENDEEILGIIKDRKSIILLNKIDLDSVITKEMLNIVATQDIIEVSAKKKEGMDRLEKCIESMFFKGDLNFNDEVYITNVRHKHGLEESITSLNQVIQSIEMGMPEDFYTIDLMNAYQYLGEIIGESIGEDLINTIFREFCMGK
ncbi:MAG: tRNA uridine-5-carboxymethylaminomethyl(34) synthesis GTPase MnmE [Velocimicrobium sp.]